MNLHEKMQGYQFYNLFPLQQIVRQVRFFFEFLFKFLLLVLRLSLLLKPCLIVEMWPA